ncbi:RidA family protein [Vibrio profundum]|uniref:RidA family protein n=1 Tax=Vibrio profundum TaxID=2910247 RepID=UPI003D0FE2D1
MVQRVNYKYLPEAIGPYAHATKYNGTLFISGLTAYGTDVQAKTLKEQSSEILSQIGHILQQERCSKYSLVKMSIFVKDVGEIENLRGQLFDFYEGALPASSLVEVSNLFHPDLKVEIEAIVALE